eukprot:Mrub_12678.p1 GENE.Mrub_12678~~Mrub_12678.p1  ORF type:complete len:170 (-),score=26.73 Mrub_12678:41-505(-)
MDEKRLSDAQIDAFQNWHVELTRRKWAQVPVSLFLSYLCTKQVTTLKMVVLDNSARFFHFRQYCPFYVGFYFFFSKLQQNYAFEQPQLLELIDEQKDKGAYVRRLMQVRLPMMWEHVRGQLVVNGSLYSIDKFARQGDFSRFGYGFQNCGRYYD